MTLDLRTSELERAFMKERINSIETHFLKISSKLLLYVKKLAALRDSGDEVATSISDFASKENYNQTLRLSLGKFSDILSSIQEYHDAQVKRIEVKVIRELETYDHLCKQTKTEIKTCFDARDKELKRKTDLEKLRSKNPHNWQKIEKAEKEVNDAHDVATNSARQLSQQIEHFEKKKLEDLKKLFLELVKIQMIFHCRAIELYTNAHVTLNDINIEEDLNEFLSHLKAHESSLNITKPFPSQSYNTQLKSLNSEDGIRRQSFGKNTMLSQKNPDLPICNYSTGEDTGIQVSTVLQPKKHSTLISKNESTNAENSNSSSRSTIESKFL